VAAEHRHAPLIDQVAVDAVTLLGSERDIRRIAPEGGEATGPAAGRGDGRGLTWVPVYPGVWRRAERCGVVCRTR